jgi:hypothetical protein
LPPNGRAELDATKIAIIISITSTEDLDIIVIPNSDRITQTNFANNTAGY